MHNIIFQTLAQTSDFLKMVDREDSDQFQNGPLKEDLTTALMRLMMLMWKLLR